MGREERGTAPDGTIADLQSLIAGLGGEALDPDRGGYTITMRENRGADDVLDRLRTLPRRPPAMHIGWGSFRNLDIVATRGSQFVLLLDVNVHQLNVWRAVAQAIEQCAGPEPFTTMLAGLMPKSPRPRRFSDSDLDWLQSDLTRPRSWLFAGAPERYAHVRELFRQRAVAVCSLDVRGTRTPGNESPLRRLPPLLHALGNPNIDTVYVSNLPYMMRQPNDFFGGSNDAWNVDVHGADGRSYRLGAYERVWLNVVACCERATHLVHADQLVPDCALTDLWWTTETGPAVTEIERCLLRFYEDQPDRSGNITLFRDLLRNLREGSRA